jgi:hypothetical protein
VTGFVSFDSSDSVTAKLFVLCFFGKFVDYPFSIASFDAFSGTFSIISSKGAVKSSFFECSSFVIFLFLC